MPQFRYKALTTAGEPLEGQMEAGSVDEVIVRLQDAGHLPLEAKAAGADEVGSALALFKPRTLDDAARREFTRQLATLLAAGQPLDRALGVLQELPEAPAARQVLARVRDAVRGGSSLSAALEAEHGLFPRLYVGMVRAGEAGGRLDSTLHRLADYLDRSAALRSRVVNAMVYPIILIGMIVLALLFLLGFVVPEFEQMYAGLGAELPLLTKLVIGLGTGVRDYWWLLLGLGLGGLVWADRARRDPAFRLGLDGWLLRRRLLGSLVAKLETARLARTLGTLLSNGVPLLSSLSIAGNVVGNRVLAASVEAAAAEVKTGSSLAQALGRQKGFPRLALQMVQVGEEAGELDTMLLRVADTFDGETSAVIDRLLSAMVPVLTVVMAAVVGLVIMAILVPLYDLTNTIG